MAATSETPTVEHRHDSLLPTTISTCLVLVALASLLGAPLEYLGLAVLIGVASAGIAHYLVDVLPYRTL